MMETLLCLAAAIAPIIVVDIVHTLRGGYSVFTPPVVIMIDMAMQRAGDLDH